MAPPGTTENAVSGAARRRDPAGGRPMLTTFGISVVAVSGASRLDCLATANRPLQADRRPANEADLTATRRHRRRRQSGRQARRQVRRRSSTDRLPRLMPAADPAKNYCHGPSSPQRAEDRRPSYFSGAAKTCRKPRRSACATALRGEDCHPAAAHVGEVRLRAPRFRRRRARACIDLAFRPRLWAPRRIFGDARVAAIDTAVRSTGRTAVGTMRASVLGLLARREVSLPGRAVPSIGA